jgi:hypothetical protein
LRTPREPLHHGSHGKQKSSMPWPWLIARCVMN